MNFILKFYKSTKRDIQDWYNDPEKICTNCNHKFFIFKEIFYCDTCEKEICENCRLQPTYLHEKYVCKSCNINNLSKIKNIIVVKSGHIGGHKILKYHHEIESDFNDNNYDETTGNLKYKAYKMGANGIISLLQHKKQHVKSTSNSKGEYIYSMFHSTGIPVNIEKNKF